jgi:hypothetical protein
MRVMVKHLGRAAILPKVARLFNSLRYPRSCSASFVERPILAQLSRSACVRNLAHTDRS